MKIYTKKEIEKTKTSERKALESRIKILEKEVYRWKKRWVRAIEKIDKLKFH